MTWHYRPVRDDHGIWSMREYYEMEDRDGPLWSADPQRPSGETLSELVSDLEMMLTDARSRPAMQEDGDKLVAWTNL